MIEQIKALEKSFIQKLRSIDADAITDDLLVKNYLNKLIDEQVYVVKIYSWVLQNVMLQTKLPLHQISFLDFGCGNGLFAMYAKHCGIKKVYGCDFNKSFIVAARVLANEMDIKVDDWFVCNEDELFNKCNHLQLDIIAGTDVIEHIYNLDIFFANIQSINPNIITAFTTASVYENYFKRKSLYKLMYQDEYVGSNILEATAKDEYAGLAYFNIRHKIISKAFPTLQNEEIIQLAKATRGLWKNDIIKQVQQYFTSKIMPKQMINKHNTCDPISGNFTERMLQLKEYKTLYANYSFKLITKTGFYAASGNEFKSIIQKGLNVFISILHHTSLSRTIAPLILLMGVPQKNKNNA